MVCPLDTTAVNELWRLDLLSCTSSSFLCAGTLSPRGKCCYFCGRFSWSRQTSLSKGFSYYFHDSTTELYFRSTTRQCRCYSKTKTTKYCLKQEGKSHPFHPVSIFSAGEGGFGQMMYRCPERSPQDSRDDFFFVQCPGLIFLAAR